MPIIGIATLIPFTWSDDEEDQEPELDVGGGEEDRDEVEEIIPNGEEENEKEDEAEGEEDNVNPVCDPPLVEEG